MQVAISGNTYPVKDQLKALGGRWNPERKCWMIPEENADKAFALVKSAPGKAAPSNRANYRPRWVRTGCRCGSIEDYARDSDCASCQHNY